MPLQLIDEDGGTHSTSPRPSIGPDHEGEVASMSLGGRPPPSWTPPGATCNDGLIASPRQLADDADGSRTTGVDTRRATPDCVAVGAVR
jgi:hypothetical protein